MNSWLDLLNLTRPLKSNEFTVNFNPQLYNAKAIASDIQLKLDDMWNELLNNAKAGRILYNESKFRLHSVELQTDSETNSSRAILNLGLTDYKSFICTQQQFLPHTIRSQLTDEQLAHPLGVGCVLITADNDIVLIKRSSACIDLPNMYDIPGGHAEPR
jgi:hypothetical protein